MFYVIDYENGAERHGNFYTLEDALNYAASFNDGWLFAISEYESEDDCIEPQAN